MAHYIGESNPGPEAGADRLQDSLLGGKPTRQALDPVNTISDFIHLGLHEATRNQRVTRVLDPSSHLCDLHKIDAVSHNVHKTHLSQGDK